MKYITYNIFAENKHSKGQKVERPIMFELHDADESGFVWRFRDLKLKHCVCSMSMATKFKVTDENGELIPLKVAEFMSAFFKHYYTYATWSNRIYIGKDSNAHTEYGLEKIASREFEDYKSMMMLKAEMDDNSISPTVIKGIIAELDDYVSGKIDIETEVGEKTKNVQKNRKVLDFAYGYID